MKPVFVFNLACSFFASLALCSANDFDGDGLPDLWQQQYGAQSLLPNDDTDGDQFDNLTESLAGTDPFDSSDYPLLKALRLDPTSPLTFEFPTRLGKQYQLFQSDDLSNFNPLGPVLYGDRAPILLSIDPEETSTASGNVIQQYWANVQGNDLSALTSLQSFPDTPDAETRLINLETQPVTGAGFGQRLLTLITPPQTGNYSFFLSSGSSANLYLSTDDDTANHVLLSQVLSAQTIEPNSWDTFASQRSAPITLTAGESYLLEVHALSATPQSHCQIAWAGPGLSDIEIITSEHLAPQVYLNSSLSPSVVFDYDYENPTTALWPNTSVVSAPAGMTGNAEHITADPGNAAAETLLFAETSADQITDHFYMRFLARLGNGHNNISIFTLGDRGNQEGPRVELDLRNGDPHVRAGGVGGADAFTEIDYNETYRIELVSSLITPLNYSIGLTERAVQPDTFDLYISDPDGNLIASHRGLDFRNEGEDIVQVLDSIRLRFSNNPNVIFDDWHFTKGSIDGLGYLNSNLSVAPLSEERGFFRLGINDADQDGDGLSDTAELLLAPYNSFLFFDPETSNGEADLNVATNILTAASGTIEFSLQASDTAAYEDNSPNLNDDHGEIIITRTGPLTAVDAKLCIAPLENTGNTSTVCDGSCCTLIGSAGDEAAEVEDYQLVDEEGNVITDTVSFKFGQMSKSLTVIAIKDTINEYPETLNIALTPDASYTISSTTNGASIQLFDLPDSPSNYAIFTGLYSQDGNAVTSTSGSGSTTAILNGPRTELRISTNFTNLTSNFQDSHIHKSNAGSTISERTGPIIFEVVDDAGDVLNFSNILATPPDPTSGSLTEHVWNISTSSGAVSTNGGEASKQVIIDSLFGQNNETSLYFNLHSVNNPAGEIWSFLELTGGSIDDPGEPTPAASPGSTEFPLLTGDALDTDIRRFLNQATFGATEEDVAALTATITSERQSNPGYHRLEAFEDWMDTQMALPQSYILDYHLASDYQQLKLRGLFDPVLNPSGTPDGEAVSTPALPSTWPTVNRSTNPDPTKWHLDLPYPINRRHQDLADDNGLNGAVPGDNTRRQAFWQMMMNAPDQFRQKAGFTLQQIVLVSVADSTIFRSHYSSSNYQDMLNTYAFSSYRDVLGFANWNPIMGKWLSSLQNQKGIDIDGDGINDTSPDENLARENMQLFSIGLFELWPDGTLRLGSDGAPNNTYTNDDIREFAKVLTGQSFAVQDDFDAGWGGVPFESLPVNDDFDLSDRDSDVYGAKYLYPMIMFGDYHDRSVKTFAGTTIDNTHLIDPTEQGVADIEDALDWLAGSPGDGAPDFDGVNSHGTTPAFICRRLIQRLTTSNPSRDYLHRVASVFQNTEGNLAETFKAILLDPEARILDLTDSHVGVKKSSLETYIQMSRNLGSFSLIPIGPNTNQYPFTSFPTDYSNPDLLLTNFGYSATVAQTMRTGSRALFNSTVSASNDALVMEPFRQDTVFNWYLPDFSPTGPVSSAGLVAPEMQIVNEQDVVRNINYYENLVHGFNGTGGAALASATDAQTLAFNGDADTNLHDNNRLDFTLLVSELYPDEPPTPTATETSEYLANLQVLDILDRRLTAGLMKARYPIDPSNDGPDGINQNPRELILAAVTYGGNNPWDGNNDVNNRLNRIEDILYLITASPDYAVKK